MDLKKIINPWVGEAAYNCFACCPDNPIGLKMTFAEDGDYIVSKWTPTNDYMSWIDTLHGGIQSVLLDEICGWVVSRKLKTAGVTSKMETRYKHPVRISGGEITLRAKIREQRRNIVIIDAELLDGNGVVCTEAVSTFFAFSREKAEKDMLFRDFKVEGEE